MGADLTTMPPRVCIQVVILVLAMSFALAESNSKESTELSAPGWIGGCKTPGVETPSDDSGRPKECLSGDKTQTSQRGIDPVTKRDIPKGTPCANLCAHKWEYSSNKGPYRCKKRNCKRESTKPFKQETLWCPKEVQTNAAKALQSMKTAGNKFPVMKEYKTSPVKHERAAFKGCKPSKYGKNDETKPVPLKFMTAEPHRKYLKSDSKDFQAHEKRKEGPNWSTFGNGIEMHPWVKPGVSNCSPDTPTNFINYYEDLATYVDKKDKIGDECYKISRRKITKDGTQFQDGTAQLLHEAGRCKFNIAGKNFCVELGDPFFCAKTYAQPTTVWDKIRVDKMKSNGKEKNKSKYFYLEIQLTMKLRKANMCERMWRHLPYTCSVKKMTEPIVVVVKNCKAYDLNSGKVGKGDNSGDPPKELCHHYKTHFPAGHQFNPNPKEIPDFKGSVSIRSWEGFTKPAPAIPHVGAIEAAVKGFL